MTIKEREKHVENNYFSEPHLNSFGFLNSAVGSNDNLSAVREVEIGA